MRQFQATHGSRHAGRAPSNQAILGDVAFRIQIHIPRSSQRSFFTKVDERGSAIGKARQQKPSAADVARVWIRHGQSQTYGHRGVNRISSGFEDAHSNVRCQWLLHHHHGVPRVLRLSCKQCGLQQQNAAQFDPHQYFDSTVLRRYGTARIRKITALLSRHQRKRFHYAVDNSCCRAR